MRSDVFRTESNLSDRGMGARVTFGEVQRAHYHVSFPGGVNRQDSYELAFVERDGTATILDGFGGMPAVALTSSDIPHLVNNYLHMGPIVAVVGTSRAFAVDKTFDSLEPRLNGMPLFLITCDRMETVAGIEGYHLFLKSTLTDDTELEMVLSPDYPFPLFIKELTGRNPLQIELVEIVSLDVALVGE